MEFDCQAEFGYGDRVIMLWGSRVSLSLPLSRSLRLPRRYQLPRLSRGHMSPSSRSRLHISALPLTRRGSGAHSSRITLMKDTCECGRQQNVDGGTFVERRQSMMRIYGAFFSVCDPFSCCFFCSFLIASQK
jgi:hypothetical protein